jgi:hypothetical protein
MSDNPLNGKGNDCELSATEISPADFPLGSPRSRAIARALAQQRTAKPKLSQFDSDARLIYGRMSCPSFGLPCGAALAPDIRHTTVYARGMEVAEMLRGPIIPAHLNQRQKRITRASGEFEICFGREPVAGDVFHYQHIALVHHPDLIEMETNLFVKAWGRRLGEFPCPVKFENGRLFHRATRGRPGSTPEWVEDISVTAQSIWRGIEEHLKWRAPGRTGNTISHDPLESIPTIPAITFLGVGPEPDPFTGMVEEKHRCRPATEEEIQRPEIEPKEGSVLAVLKKALARSENPMSAGSAST